MAISSESCGCGCPFRIVRAIAGRVEDVLVFRGASAAGSGSCAQDITVQPKEFHALLERAGIDAWQVEGGGDALLVRVQGVTRSCCASNCGGRLAMRSRGWALRR
ncbi:MAG: hypothetical protein U1F35_08995 [Steroidobacteraceae bacterium]